MTNGDIMGLLFVAILASIFIPLLGYILLSHEAKKNREKETHMDREFFVIRASKPEAISGTLLIMIGCAYIVLIVYIKEELFGVWRDALETGLGPTIFMGVGGVLFVAFPVFLLGVSSWGIYAYVYRKLIVKGNCMIYYPCFKKKQIFSFSKITKIQERPVVYGITSIIAYSGHSRLFQFDSLCLGYGLLLEKARREAIPFEVVSRTK
jgi:hypothetical protein